MTQDSPDGPLDVFIGFGGVQDVDAAGDIADDGCEGEGECAADYTCLSVKHGHGEHG